MTSESAILSASVSNPALRAYLLGPLRLYVNGEEVPERRWKSKKALTLFLYLLTRRGTKVHREVILELLWPEEDPESAAGKLHPTLYMLRRTLQPDLQAYEESAYVRSAHGNYWIDDGPTCWVDIEAFKSMHRRSAELEEKDPEQALTLCEQGIELYRGDFLPEETWQDWAITLRQYYRELFIDMALRAAKLVMQLQGNVSSAVRFCREALACDPYREEVYQALMTHLIEAGHYAEAARQYRRVANLLRDEFGLEPSPETTALFEQMKRGLDGTVNAEQAAEAAKGPLVVDRATFDIIHSLFLRQQGRDGRPVSVLEITPTGAAANDRLRSAIMRSLEHVLRRSDVMCWDGNKARLLLLTCDRGSEVVKRRIERRRIQDGLPPLSITVEVYKKEDIQAGTVNSRPGRSLTQIPSPKR